jgi:hypothetical protein
MKGMKVSDSPSPRRHSRRALVFRLLRRSRLLPCWAVWPSRLSSGVVVVMTLSMSSKRRWWLATTVSE